MSYAIRHVDEIPADGPAGEVPIRAVRHYFGISSFGVNAWVAQDAGDRLVPEHDEDPGNEELYIVTRGRAMFELDGERCEAPAGTLVFARESVQRTAFAEEPGTTIVVGGATRGKPYEAVGWELWHPLRKRYEAGGEHEAVAAELRRIVAENPQYPLLQYNLACLDSLTGRPDEAIEHLGMAIEGSERFREYARGDSDLDAVRDDPRVQRLLAGNGE